MIMTITKKELQSLNACSAGLDRFIHATNNTDNPVQVSDLFDTRVTASDLCWLAVRKCRRVQIIQFCYDMVVFSGYKPVMAIDVGVMEIIEHWLENPSDDNYETCRQDIMDTYFLRTRHHSPMYHMVRTFIRRDCDSVGIRDSYFMNCNSFGQDRRLEPFLLKLFQQ